MNRAFTVIEVLVVISLLVVIGSLSVLAGSEGYRRAIALSDTGRVISVLYRARSLAQAGACRTEACAKAMPQIVHIEKERVSLLEGWKIIESYPLSGEAEITPTEISFLPRTGELAASSSVKMRAAFGRERMITVSPTGIISVD